MSDSVYTPQIPESRPLGECLQGTAELLENAQAIADRINRALNVGSNAADAEVAPPSLNFRECGIREFAEVTQRSVDNLNATLVRIEQSLT